jgi:hypothetical protein
MTGEPGAGKTWLTHQLSCILPSNVVSVSVDVTRAMGALDFLQLIGHALGIPFSDSLGVARSRLNAALSDDAVDGKRWLLVVDEAHRAGSLIWDEIKAMVNHAGGAGGFDAIVILGDTPLVRALAGRDFRGFASSLRVHVHLPPLDLDEARELLVEVGHDVDSLSNILEELHRDARGNPGRLLRLASGSLRSSSPGAVMGSNREALTAEQSPSRRFPRAVDPPGPEENENPRFPQTTSVPATKTSHAVSARTETPALIPTKPPIRVEDGLVEVGWDGDLEDEPGETEYTMTGHENVPAGDSSFNEELIEDRYAAIQAWSEWTKIQEKATGRGLATQASLPRGSSELQPAESESPAVEEAPESLDAAPGGTTPGIRAEREHEFAPYSQLFTRLRQSKQP